jgi:Barrel-sandwich domain of CusB or HlyD membrane-fusion
MLDTSLLIGANGPPLSTEVPLLTQGTSPAAANASHSDHDENLARMLAAVVALQSSLDAASTLEDAGSQAARTICDYLSASRVFVLWRPDAEAALRCIGDSQPALDADESAPLLIGAAEEVAARGSETHWPPQNSLGRHSMLAIAHLASHFQISSLNAISLLDEAGVDHGVIMVLAPASSAQESFLRVAAMPLASTFARIARTQPSGLERLVRETTQFVSGRYRRLLIFAVAATALLLLLPFRYRVSATVELQPVTRRFVSVPFDGPLLNAAVKTGDIVKAGDLLAAISPREIDFELAGQMALAGQAEQERKTMMSKHDFAGRELAELEVERLRQKTELLQYQREHLEVRSPIDGVIVSGDLSQSEGMMMTRGKTLMEIAPLGKMYAEVSIPESDIAEVREGMPVSYSLNAYPGLNLTGDIVRIHPSAELREHENVFIALVELNDSEGLFRPGMRGRAKIIGDRHPLAWNLFHRAYFALCQWIGC